MIQRLVDRLSRLCTPRIFPGLVLIAGLVALVVAAYLIGSSHVRARRQLDQRFIDTTREATQGIIASHADFSRFVIHEQIMKPEVLDSLLEHYHSGDLDEARAELFDRFDSLFGRLVRYGFRQLHFHLPNGRSLLRMHAPGRWGDYLFPIRESVRIANTEGQDASGFEVGRITSGYRFVYPLVHRTEALGSVELSISFVTIADALREKLDVPGELVVRKDLLEARLFAHEQYRYGESPLTERYLVDFQTIEGGEPSWASRVRRELADRRPLAHHVGDDFVTPIGLNRAGYAVVFLAVTNTSGEHAGYFVTYHRTGEYRSLIVDTLERALLISLVIGGLAIVGVFVNHARRLAEEANRAKSQFLANVSHELRTPMSGITGMIDALQEEGNDTQRREYLRLLRGASDDMEHIVTSILEMSRIEAGRVELVRERFVPAHTISDVVESMRSARIAAGLALRANTEERAHSEVMGDPLRVRQVVRNCLHNALKFTDEGGVTVHVRMADTKGDSAMLEITITDTGRGIPEDQISTIFDKFAQIRSDQSDSQSGSGLGLSIVTNLLSMMGGTINVRSMEGVGTTVSLSIPVEPAPADGSARRNGNSPEQSELPDESTREPSPPPLPAHADELDHRPAAGEPVKLRVLLAEDDNVNRTVMVALLSRHGMDVTTAVDGRRAFDLACSGKFDVILMDRKMPGMDGLEATRRLCASWREQGVSPVPVIGLSGATDPEDRSACRHAGMSGFVAKPVDAGTLLDEIKRHGMESPPIDISQTQGTLGDLGELVHDILPIFLEQTTERFERIRAALEHRDHAAVHAETHPLKTAAIYLGARNLSETARRVDELCRQTDAPDWDEVHRLVDRLREEIRRVDQWRHEHATTA